MKKNRFEERDEAEKALSQDPRTIDGYDVRWDEDQYVIDLFTGQNVF